jgi:hypothetical protein
MDEEWGPWVGNDLQSGSAGSVILSTIVVKDLILVQNCGQISDEE